MPIQRFAPMTKDFATFDCDAHVTEPSLIWERAHEFLTRDEIDALKQTIWWDAESAPGAPAGVLRRHPGVVIRRLSPRRRRCLAGDRDDAEIRPAGRRSGQVPRRQCAAPL